MKLLGHQFEKFLNMPLEDQRICRISYERNIVLTIKQLVIIIRRLRKNWQQITTIGDTVNARPTIVQFWEIIRKSADYDSKMLIWSFRLRKLLVMYGFEFLRFQRFLRHIRCLLMDCRLLSFIYFVNLVWI